MRNRRFWMGKIAKVKKIAEISPNQQKTSVARPSLVVVLENGIMVGKRMCASYQNGARTLNTGTIKSVQRHHRNKVDITTTSSVYQVVLLRDSYFGCLLPGIEGEDGGNAAEFPEIRETLEKLDITWKESTYRDNTTLFWFTSSEATKLPADNQKFRKLGQYLPVSEDGHSIFELMGIFREIALPKKKYPQKQK